MKSRLKMCNKEIAIDFLQLSAFGKADIAFAKYVGGQFRHHNPFFKGDADSLMIAMMENAKVNPNKIFEVQNAVEDGDLVIVHSKVTTKTNNLDFAVVHVFRFHNNRITELWDIGQAVPADSPNENGMF